MKTVTGKSKIGIGEEPRKKNRNVYGSDRLKEEALESILSWIEEGLDRCQIEHSKELRCVGCNVTVSLNLSISEGKEMKDQISIRIHECEELKAESEELATVIYKNFKEQRPDDLVYLVEGKGMLLNCKELQTRASIAIRIKGKVTGKVDAGEVRDFKKWRDYAEILCKSICEFIKTPYLINEKTRFTVQVGAYRLISNAIGVRDKLICQGFEDACIKKGKLYGSDIYRVQTGSFRSFENIQILASQLRANNFYAAIKEIL